MESIERPRPVSNAHCQLPTPTARRHPSLVCTTIMDLGNAEMGFPHRQGSRDLYNLSTGFRPVDPFTLSISQVARNNANASGIENVDDVPLPRRPSNHFPGAHRQTPSGTFQPASSLSTARSRRRSHSSRRDHDQGSVHPTASSPHPTMPSYPPTISASPLEDEAFRISSNFNTPYPPVLDFQQRADASPHPIIYDTLIGRGPSVNLINNSRHGSLSDHSMPRPPVDTALVQESIKSPSPISAASSRSSRSLAVRFAPRVTLWENIPQQPYYRSSDSFTQPTLLMPSPSHVIPGASISQYSPAENEISTHDALYGGNPITDAALVPVKDHLRPGTVFVTDILPRQVYLHLLLRLPSFYFSRVSRIFTEADLTLGEIKEMALQAYTENYSLFDTGRDNQSGITTLSPAYEKLKLVWEQFIDDLIREWKTLNIISVLLLSAIMTTFQIPGAAEDPLTRYLAFWSLICALMSLLYGCSFIIRFASMRKAYKAVEWAIEAQKTQTVFWNVWVMLAMPLVWMTWSILTFIASIMSFMWRAKTNLPSDFEFSVAPSTEFGFRIFICIVLGLGVVYGTLIIGTFRRYGSRMDETWTSRVRSYIDDPYSKSRYHSTTFHSNSSDRVNFGSTTSLPLHSLTPSPVNFPDPESDDASRTINSPLLYHPRFGMSPEPGMHSAKSLPETSSVQLPRSKSTSSLPRLLIPDNDNVNKDTKFPHPQSHLSTSISSRHSLLRHPIFLENNNTDLPLRPPGRQLRRSTSDNLTRYSLAHYSMPAVSDPNYASSPLRRDDSLLSSNRSPLATRYGQAQTDVDSHPQHMPRSPSNSDKASEVVRGRTRLVEEGSSS